MKESLSPDCDPVRGIRFLPMEIAMMGNGLMISHRAGGFMSGSTKTDTKGSFSPGWRKEKAVWNGMTEPDMKVIFLEDNRMVKASKLG